MAVDERAPRPGPMPHVLIVGGFLTEPLNYRPMRRRLLERSAASVSVAPVHLPDWLAAGLVGFGPLLVRTGLAVRRAWRAADRQPILVVGHSAGGILTRLAMSPVPFRGRRAAVADAIACLVTLGTPHDLDQALVPYAHRGIEAARHLARHTPGAHFAPTTAYLTCGSALVRPAAAPARRRWDRFRGGLFRGVVGPLGAAGGDGIVSVTAVHLRGARQLTFDDVRHGHIGGPWYGDDPVIDRWWPVAVELWRTALAARAERAAGIPVRPAAAEVVAAR